MRQISKGVFKIKKAIVTFNTIYALNCFCGLIFDTLSNCERVESVKNECVPQFLLSEFFPNFSERHSRQTHGIGSPL